ncbi:MAG: efflux RND transporter periplasmic adaptor subunit [Lentisphaerae bacterium]|nr:efflux RND transporter periplasmic adaptor subunit [Lentisphaerota bacterium]
MTLVRYITRKRAGVLLTLSLMLLWGFGRTIGAEEGAADACCPADHSDGADAGAEGHEHGHDDHDNESDDHTDEEDHVGHDHAGHADEDRHAAHGDDAGEDEHAGHDHSSHEEEGLRLTAEQRERFGIVMAAAEGGDLRQEIRLSGEIVFNEDRLVHLVPRASGIAMEIFKTLGDHVRIGETMARIDSAELAAATLDYFAAVTEVGCCQFELPRAQSINDNVLTMLKLLKTSPSVEALGDSNVGEMGDNGSRLISSYSEYVLAKKAYERERSLMAKKITSEGEFLAAESAYEKAQASYYGTRDSVAYDVRQTLLEVTRDRQLAEFKEETERQRLLLLGLSEAEVAGLGPLPQATADTLKPPAHECTDPNCTNCAKHEAVVAPPSSRSTPGWYEVKAPCDGVIIQKHLSLGEHVDNETDIFTIVDTESVWVNLTVYAKDLAAIRKGQSVMLRADHDGAEGHGTIAMVTPFVMESTRSATARVELDNRDGKWVPGTFVTGFITSSEVNLPVVVSRQAVQNIESRTIVFVEHEGAFEATPVTLGRADRTHVEVVTGLKPGTRYVAEGAYQLKATVITSNLGSHAGHGH